MRDAEHRTQTACVWWFRCQYPSLAGLLFAIPNGGARDVVTGKRLKDEGVLAGVADLFLSVPGRDGSHGLYIEMKTPKGVQSEAQKTFQTRVEAQGYTYRVCRSFDDFSACVAAHLGVDRNLI